MVHRITGTVFQHGAKLMSCAFVALAALVSAPSAYGDSSTVHSPPAPAVLTFQAWKSLRTDEARLILERLTLESQIFAASSSPVVADRAPGERQAVVRPARVAPEAAPATTTSRSAGRAALRPRTDGRLDARVEQARLNLEIAQDLTINDYLQIYLSQFKTADVLRDVARRMNPDEVADLLIAYQRSATLGSSQNEYADSGVVAQSRLCSGASR